MLARTPPNGCRLRHAGSIRGAMQDTPGDAAQLDYRPLVDRAPFGVFRTDATGACIYTNAEWQRIYGLSLAQSLGDGWAHGVHPEERSEVFRRWLEDATAGRPFDMRFRVLGQDGEARDVRSRAWAVQGGGFVGIVEDRTALVRQERQLQETLELLDRTGRLAGVGGWVIDLQRPEVRWSTETARIHDRPLDWQPTVEDGITYYTAEAQPVIRGLVERAVGHGEAFDVELPFVTAAGREIWVRAVGEADRPGGPATRVFGAFQDVTARRAQEAEIHASRERLRRLYEDTPALLASVDAAALVRSCSMLLLERLGRTRESVVGQPATNLLHGEPAQREQALATALKALRSPGGIRDLPVDLAHDDGSAVPTRLSADVERDASGRAVRTLAVFVDESEVVRRRAELARERALREQVERQAEELRRLAEERREMLDLLAHEVRQPLNNASAALQSAGALAGARHDDAGSQRVARAQGVIGHVVAQIDNTLAAAALLVGGGAAECADIDIDTLVQLVLADLAPGQRARVRVVRDTPTRTGTLEPGLMRLALRNLLVNALLHGTPGTPVVLRLADSDQPLALLFDVEDAGPGVEAAVRERLFERGVRGARSRGQGLGLYIAQRALERHGGTVQLLHSAPGRTVFRAVLTQGADAAATRPAAP